MCTVLKDFYNNIGKKVSFWLPLILFSIAGYGFSICNRTVSVDDLAGDVYLGSQKAMLAATRWGQVFWMKVVSIPVFSPFINKFLGVCFFFCAACVMACIFYYLKKGEQQVWSYTVMASILLTYPLMNEIWEFNGANMIVTGNLLLAALVLLGILTSSASQWKVILCSGVVLSIVVSSYESGAFAYVTAVCAILFYKYCITDQKKSSWTKWFLEGVKFAVPLVIAVMLRFIIGGFLIWINHLSYRSNGNTEIGWGNQSVPDTIISVLKSIGIGYGFRGLVYFPITVFVGMAVLFVIICIVMVCRQRRVLPVILGGIVVLSLFLLPMIQGSSMQYRTAQTITVFVAFAAFLVMEFAFSLKRKWMRAGSVVIGLFLAWHQSAYLNQVFALNNQRSDNEIAVVHEIGPRLLRDFEKKEIVFVGNYDMGEWIQSKITVNEDTLSGKLYSKILGRGQTEQYDPSEDEFIGTNVNSVLEWSSYAFGNQSMMEELFSYCGYDIQVMEPFSWERYENICQIAYEKGMKPFEIADMGDYLVVCLGKLERDAKQ